LNEVEWIISPGLVEYPDALKVMDERVDLIQKGNAKELVWLLEHPPLYSAGTSAKPQDLLTPNRFPVFKTGRGGQYTYHGPGQRVAYVMLDLNRRRRDIRAYVSSLETWIINTLAKFNIRGERRSDRIGIWVRRTDLNNPEREDKIGAIGIRIKRWVTLHGISINVSSDLEHFGGIIPCGIGGYGVTSFEDIGQPLEFYDLDVELRTEFDRLFGEYGEMALK
jgi:lipoyl(octanoyl) transferase